MYLKGLHSGNKFEFPIASTLTHKTNTNTQKEQNLTLQDKNKRVKFNNFLYFFQTKIPLIKNKQCENGKAGNHDHKCHGNLPSKHKAKNNSVGKLNVLS